MKALFQKHMVKISVITMMLNDNNHTIYVLSRSKKNNDEKDSNKIT